MAILTSTQKIALSVCIALLLASGIAPARDWRWYPRKSRPDSGALRPDLEGVKADDPEQQGMSELEEMRQWLRQRDEDRRQQGITVPDTVEQLEPAGDVTVRRRQWPERLAPGLGADHSAGDLADTGRPPGEQSERIRDTLYPQSSGQGLAAKTPPGSRHRYSSSPRRYSHHRGSASSRSRTKGRSKRRH